MKQVAVLIVFIMCLSCTRKEVKLNFCDTVYHTKQNSCFVLENDTDINYIFYPPSFIGDEEWGYLGASVRITDEEGKEPRVNTVYIHRGTPTGKAMDQYILNGHKDTLLWKKLLTQGVHVDYWGAKQHKVITKTKFVLNPGDEKEISEKISIFRKDLESSGSYYSFDQKKKYFIQIELDFDSTEIKKYLPAEQLDSLKKNNLKIFHGIVKTKKIPIILD